VKKPDKAESIQINSNALIELTPKFRRDRDAHS
jgi:hypothetical protein